MSLNGMLGCTLYLEEVNRIRAEEEYQENKKRIYAFQREARRNRKRMAKLLAPITISHNGRTIWMGKEARRKKREQRLTNLELLNANR